MASTFYRGINLGGGAVTIDSNAWEASGSAANFSTNGWNGSVSVSPLVPAVTAGSALETMLRSVIYNANPSVTLSNVPAGEYEVYIYRIEDDWISPVTIKINGTTVGTHGDSGVQQPGYWWKLGAHIVNLSSTGSITVEFAGEAWALMAGVEVWQVTGGDPDPDPQTFSVSRLDNTPTLYSHTLTHTGGASPETITVARIEASVTLYTHTVIKSDPDPVEEPETVLYTAVCWARSNVGQLSGKLVVIDQDGHEIAASPDTNIGRDWVKLSRTITPTVSVTGLQLAFVNLSDTSFDYDLTGFGIYAGSEAIDFNSGSLDTDQEDVTKYVLAVSGDTGSNANISNMTPIEGQLEIILNNVGREWTPRNQESPFYEKLLPLTLIEVQIERGNGTWEAIWTGFYESIALTPGTTGDMQARIIATQGLLYMSDNRVIYTPKENQTTTQIIRELIDQAFIPSDRLSWRLGEAQLGINTHFTEPGAYSDIDESNYIHSIAGAGLSDTTTMRDFFNDLITNSGGFAFYDRDGRIVFRSRERLFPSVYSTD